MAIEKGFNEQPIELWKTGDASTLALLTIFSEFGLEKCPNS